MTWPSETEETTWGDRLDAPAVADGQTATVRVLRVELPRQVGVHVAGWIVRRQGTPSVTVQWSIRLGVGRAVVPLTHSAPVQTEIVPGEWRMISGANVQLIQRPARSVEIVARVTPSGGDLATGDVRVAAAVAPSGSLTWEQDRGED